VEPVGYPRHMRFVTWLLTYAAGLAVAAWLLDGIFFDGPANGQGEIQEKIVPLFVVALILGLVSTFIEPVIKLISLPFIILTLGFLLLVINALMLMLTARLADAFDLGFHVEGFWNALLGAIIVTVVGWGVRTALPSRD
jgi:putative membrane protein